MNKDKFKANYICVTVLNDKLTLKQKVSYYRKTTIQLLILQKLQVCRSLLSSYLDMFVKPKQIAALSRGPEACFHPCTVRRTSVYIEYLSVDACSICVFNQFLSTIKKHFNL